MLLVEGVAQPETLDFSSRAGPKKQSENQLLMPEGASHRVKRHARGPRTKSKEELVTSTMRWAGMPRHGISEVARPSLQTAWACSEDSVACGWHLAGVQDTPGSGGIPESWDPKAQARGTKGTYPTRCSPELQKGQCGPPCTQARPLWRDLPVTPCAGLSMPQPLPGTDPPGSRVHVNQHTPAGPSFSPASSPRHLPISHQRFHSIITSLPQPTMAVPLPRQALHRQHTRTGLNVPTRGAQGLGLGERP